MESESVKFGGPRELGGAQDLITQYKLLPHHEFFCKRSLPESFSDAHYLHNVVGETEIRKGEGMQLDQLIPNASLSRVTNARIQTFVLDELKEAFELNDTAPVECPPTEKGAPTIASKSKSESKDRDRKHRKQRTGARRKIRNIRSTSTSIKIGAKIRIGTERRKKVIRKGNTMGMKILMTLRGTKRIS